MKKQPRWMKSVIKASQAETPVLPFQRQYRRDTVASRRILRIA